jgi:hypothetical protein
VTREPKPLFGETTDRNEAFPGIKSLTVKVVQDPYRHYGQEQRETVYSKSDIPRHVRCVNQRCRQGGIDLQQLVWFSGAGEYRFPCNGHEGSPKGRRRGEPCDSTFVITVTIEKDESADRS